jgi:hypothetical protein
LEAECKYCPIGLNNTGPIPVIIDKPLEDTLNCTLCNPADKDRKFKVGEQVDLCVYYPNGEQADICVGSITDATVYQSTLSNPDYCREQHGCHDAANCPCFDFDPFHLVFDNTAASATPLYCGYMISFVLGNRWFTGVKAGYPLALEVEALLKYGHSRRLGQDERALQDAIPVTFISDDISLDTTDCNDVKQRIASLESTRIRLQQKAKKAKGQAKAKLLQRIASINDSLKQEKPLERALCI